MWPVIDWDMIKDITLLFYPRNPKLLETTKNKKK
jgi:hypothetical protein